jgi:hypothetical protein
MLGRGIEGRRRMQMSDEDLLEEEEGDTVYLFVTSIFDTSTTHSPGVYLESTRAGPNSVARRPITH